MSEEHAAAGGSRKIVFVHVGAPKTGTTYLQNVLWQNRRALAEDGFCYPMQGRMEHFGATLDLRGMGWGGKRNPAHEGAWERVAARARAWQGSTVIISNELLGGVTDKQAREAVESLQPAEVHVVFTARDLARQLPSDWQEHLKHRHTVTFERFVDDLVELGIDAPHPFGEMFWGLHDAVRVLHTWSAAVPPERLHVVTVPQPGAPKGLLWERFAGLLGMDPGRYDSEVPHANTSIGQADAEFLRRLNVVLGENRLGERYDPLVRVGLAETILAARPQQPKIVLPPERYPWVRKRSEELIEGIHAGGYDVVGELDELLPAAQEGSPSGPGPDHVAAEALVEVGIDAVAGLLDNPVPLTGRERKLQQRITELEQTLEDRRRKPYKTLLRELSEKRKPLRRVRVLWWRLAEWGNLRR